MRTNPYNTLLSQAKKFAFSVKHPHTRTMWLYPKDKLAENWSLDGLAHRVQAADQLGYDVKLVVEDGALVVKYVKRFEIPSRFLI